jgi:hypothetical protein
MALRRLVMEPTRTIMEVPVAPEDRERVAQLMLGPQTRERDREIAAVLGPYFGMLATVVPVPLGHTHDGKKHEGIEIHFRPTSRSGYRPASRDQEPVTMEDDFVGEDVGDGELGIINGCTEPPRNLPPDDPTAQLCYLDPPGVCRSC